MFSMENYENCQMIKQFIIQFVEGWVNTETLVGSLQTEAGIKSKDEIKSFLQYFELDNDIGTVYTSLTKARFWA